MVSSGNTRPAGGDACGWEAFATGGLVPHVSPAVPRPAVNLRKRSQTFLAGAGLLLLFATLGSAVPAAAQSGSEWQLYGGTSFLWAKTSPYAGQLNLSTLHEFGWQTDISQYPW